MLTKFRAKHVKKILWVLTAIITLSFGLWRASMLDNQEKGATIILNNKKISSTQFEYYFKMAQVYLLINAQEERKITHYDIENLGLDFLVLLWKAGREKIRVADKEVIEYIKNHRFMKAFFPKGRFDESIYKDFLQFISSRYNLALSPRGFEEYIRDFIKIDKLFAKHIDVTATEEEILDIYKKDNLQAKIEYIFIPYDKFRVEIGITPKEIEDFYAKNKDLFEVPAKAKIDYILIDEDEQLSQELMQEALKAKSLKKLNQEFSFKINEAGFISLDDPIPEIGWQPEINKIAFSLEKGNLSPPLDTEKGILIIEKKDHQQAYVPALDEIKQVVKEKLIETQAKDETERFSKDLLNQIKDENITDFKKLALQKRLEFKETNYFKYYDYIEGLGLNKEVSENIFSLKEDQLYKEPALLENGAYIIRLKDLTDIDKEDYQKRKDTYAELIKQNKRIAEKIKFLARLKEEVELKIIPEK